MHILPALLLLSAAALAGAQTSNTGAGSQHARALALRSQHILNEYAVGAMEPEAMKYAQRLRLTRAAFDTQHRQWLASGAAAQDAFSACKSALESASHVAGLSGQKAFSAVDDKVFSAAKARLQQLRAGCDAQIRRESPAG